MNNAKNEVKKVLSTVSDSAKIDIDNTSPGRTMIIVTQSKNDLIKQKYPKLIGQPITVTEAAEKYGIHRNTILKWVKNGYITVIKPGYQMTIDAAYIAYCAEAYKSRKAAGFGFSGYAPILDDDGLLYQLKHPDRAKKRQSSSKN